MAPATNIAKRLPLSLSSVVPTAQRTVLPFDFVGKFASDPSPFDSALSEFVYRKTYARIKDQATGRKEVWYETVQRVANGALAFQQAHHVHNGMAWDEKQALDEFGKPFYERVFRRKLLPPGRGLWAMGTRVVEEKCGGTALNNCAFVSTANLGERENPAEPFINLMDMSMLGVGVGFDTLGKGSIRLYKTRKPLNKREERQHTHVVKDTREGWYTAVQVALLQQLRPDDPANNVKVKFDFSQIRPAGVPLADFGGVSSGPDPLKFVIAKIREYINVSYDHQVRLGIAEPRITVVDIVNIMNAIGVGVVSGNVRRSAEIALCSHDDPDFSSIKDWTLRKNKYRRDVMWASNNSNVIYAQLMQEQLRAMFARDIENVVKNGEPGWNFLFRAQSHGRLIDEPNGLDHKAAGTNPCGEQTLEDGELCNLVEVFICNHDSLQDFLETLRLAFTYAKTVTLAPVHIKRSDIIVERNRRTGVSLSGVHEFLAKPGNNLQVLQEWLERGYEYICRFDHELSTKWRICESIKKTTEKPSGTVSILAGVSQGIHYPHAEYYFRRVRVQANSALLPPLVEAGYPVEPASDDPTKSTLVVTFPVRYRGRADTKYKEDAAVEDQLELLKLFQTYWSDNQVSVTVHFDREQMAAREGWQPLTYENQYAMLRAQHCIRGNQHPDELAEAQAKRILAANEQRRNKLCGKALVDVLMQYEPYIKSLSMLPLDRNVYKQMPYETVRQEEYVDAMKHIQPIVWDKANPTTPQSMFEVEEDRFCNSDRCEYVPASRRQQQQQQQQQQQASKQ